MAREIILDPKSLSGRDLAALKQHRACLAEMAAAEAGARGKAAPRMTVRLSLGDTEEDVPQRTFRFLPA